MNKRFLTIWATVGVGGSLFSMGAKDPIIAAVSWTVMGFVAAIIDSKIPEKATKRGKNG